VGAALGDPFALLKDIPRGVTIYRNKGDIPPDKKRFNVINDFPP
jgi:hypothetical protein